MAKETKRERFFSKTLVLMHKKGFKATTMRDIAQNLKFEVANVYNYIDTKQAFLEESLFGIQKEFLRTMDVIDSSELHALAKLEYLISSYIQITSKRPYEQALLVNEWRNLTEPKLEEFIERRKNYEQKLKAIILEGVGTGAFREIEPEMAAQLILATLRWSYKLFLEDEPKINPLTIQKQVLGFVCYGILQK